jgi:thiosulfate dehydrogenase [quinone] large subunit
MATGPSSDAAASAIDRPLWQNTAIAILSIRIVQGFIYWGGGSRRFIYDPEKLDPSAHQWMANKLQAAMPGALFGTDHAISYMLGHFEILYATLIIFSAAELLAGLMLILGLLTRLAALAALGFSVMLMVIFGWQGAVCLEGWTMAACNIAMACALLLMGSGAYSLDNVLLRRNPHFADHRWFRWTSGSLPLPVTANACRKLGLTLSILAVGFVVLLYNYYRGAVLTPFHAGPVSPSIAHYSLSDVRLTARGVSFTAYLDAGSPETPSFIVDAALLDDRDAVIARWDASTLGHLSPSQIGNDYPYNRFVTGPYGLVAEMGARARIELPMNAVLSLPSPVRLTLTTVDGRVFTAPVAAQ